MAKAIGYMKPDIDPNTRLYVPFNEGVGNIAKDYSQYGNHAQLTDVEWSPDGFNGAGKFNGSSSKGDCGTDSSLDLDNNFTMKTLYKGTDKGQHHILLAWGEQAVGKRRSIWLSMTTGYLGFSGNNANITTTHIAIDGLWHVFIVDKDIADLINVYANGILRASATPALVAYSWSGTKIGCNPIDTENTKGLINEVIIRALVESPAQIAADCYEVCS